MQNISHPYLYVIIRDRMFQVVDVGVHAERQRTEERYDPKAGDDPHGPLETGHRVQVQGVTDGEVPLRRKGHYRQHGHVRCPANERTNELLGNVSFARARYISERSARSLQKKIPSVQGYWCQ